MEIHTNLTKDEAYSLMCEGHKIAHEGYTDEEFLYMKGDNIYDENGYNMGTYYGIFWDEFQKWETGWRTINGA